MSDVEIGPLYHSFCLKIAGRDGREGIGATDFKIKSFRDSLKAAAKHER